MAKKSSKGKVQEPKGKEKGEKAVRKEQPVATGPQVPVGTKLQKLDRQGEVRCECTVEEGGFRYGKTVFRSLSAAAAAAADSEQNTVFPYRYPPCSTVHSQRTLP